MWAAAYSRESITVSKLGDYGDVKQFTDLFVLVDPPNLMRAYSQADS